MIRFVCVYVWIKMNAAGVGWSWREWGASESLPRKWGVGAMRGAWRGLAKEQE